MHTEKQNPERVVTFSDGVFAVIITLLVLDLRPPHTATLAGLLSLWPSALAYAVSYLFLAIVWLNHHHLLRLAPDATPRLIWGNFAHLFTVSLIPFTTAWIADTRLGALPVAVYAVVFLLVNATYIALCVEAVDRQNLTSVAPAIRRTMRIRALITLATFVLAAALALIWPVAGLALICLCLVVYVQPDVTDAVVLAAFRPRQAPRTPPQDPN
jgi:uncharacterized membrane protein